MQIKMQVIDAFTKNIFQGNPAAVILLTEWLDITTMQAIATENNLSETAFVKHLHGTEFEIRWFSPLKEIDFCGHATLAAAFVLFNQSLALQTVTFDTASVGRLVVVNREDGLIEMDFPSMPPQPIEVIPEDLIKALPIPPYAVLRNQQAYFAIFQDEQTIRDIQPDIKRLVRLAPYDLVVSASGLQSDFVSRYFWPANGGDEDPVTGSIHTGLTPYWASILNKSQLVARQLSQRGGDLHCELKGDRVSIAGQAVQYASSVITVPDIELESK